VTSLIFGSVLLYILGQLGHHCARAQIVFDVSTRQKPVQEVLDKKYADVGAAAKVGELIAGQVTGAGMKGAPCSPLPPPARSSAPALTALAAAPVCRLRPCLQTVHSSRPPHGALQARTPVAAGA
jgi:hypothetical protein